MRRTRNRQGLTLLFVVSMIVLFLLMGTSFVIIANDYFRASKSRAKKPVHSIDRTALIHHAFYELVRGPDLHNTNSPLRGQDLLSDMYGYGFKGVINGTPAVADVPGTEGWATPRSSNGQLVEFQLRSPTTATADDIQNLRSDADVTLSDIPGHYNNHLMTFTTGPAKGVSSRIVDYQIDVDSSGVITARRFIALVAEWADAGTVAVASLEDETVIVNRLPFVGYGAGGFTNGTEGSSLLGASALSPNRIGIDFATLTGPGGYLSNNGGPNESYDGPDYQNMYLSGYDSSGGIIPSFFRPSLGSTSAGGPANRVTFGAFDGHDTLAVDNDNDGEADSIWMDTGLQIQTNQNGVRYKPLVSYRVVDMDGLLNLNAHGNSADLLYQETVDSSGSGLSKVAFSGQGYGPSDVSLSELNGTTDYRSILEGRYGTNSVPGATGQDSWVNGKLYGYPTGNNVVGGLFATAPMDIRGRFAISTPATPEFLDLNYGVAFNNGLPVTDFSVYDTTYDMAEESPYESNFAPGQFRRWEPGDDDVPYEAIDLEKMLRPFDVDSSALSARLTNLVPGIASDDVLRKSITTDSYEVPMGSYYTLTGTRTMGSLRDVLRAKLRASGAFSGFTDVDLDPLVSYYLSPEVMQGLRMDVNRPFGNGQDNANGVSGDPSEFTNGVIDEPSEVDEYVNSRAMDLNNDHLPGTNDELARVQFARHLYILALLVGEDDVNAPGLTTDDFRKAIAQWAINVVDFRDPDSINTPFEFDLNPWDGWDVDGVISPGEMDAAGGRSLVWGLERPELLFAESMATHDRRTEDLTTDNGGGDDIAGGDSDFDSRLVPQTSAFFEIYNPWTQNTNNQILPAELADGTGSGIDLQKVTPGNNPIWRIAIKRQESDTSFIRSIVFADPSLATTAVTDGGEEFFTTHTIPAIAPGVMAVVGSAGNSQTSSGGFRTTFGRVQLGVEGGGAGTLMLDDTRSITLIPTMDPNDDQIVRNEWDSTALAMGETTTKGIAVVIDEPRSLSLSDPNTGYPINPPADLGMDVGDGYGYGPGFVRDVPLDEGADPLDLAAIWNNGTTDQFRFAYLQRLANPLLDWDADTNPYISIDVTPVDLLSFNGVQNNPDNGAAPTERDPANGVLTDGTTDFGSLERGESGTETNVLFQRDYGENASEPAPGSLPVDGHNLSYIFEESFSRTNSTYTANTNYFAWLTWNNRPFVSQYELANVPHIAPENLTEHFTILDGALNPFTDNRSDVDFNENLGGVFGHLLNFHGFDDTAAGSERLNLYRLFDYTEVPSRYVGTEKWLNPDDFQNNPFNFVRHLRYPGKINLNTIPNETVFNALMGSYTGQLGFAAFDASRWNGSEFRPYRNSNEGGLVPAGRTVEENVDCGLFRRTAPADNSSIFDYTGTTSAGGDSTRSAYYRNAMRQRLGNLVTTRSSVFAIWITVGYFEVDENDELIPNPTGPGGVEVGADIGEAKRNRGFYIYDRSIPVGFEPGKNHNVERGILVQSIIE